MLKQTGPVRYIPENDTVSVLTTGNIVLHPNEGVTIDQIMSMDGVSGEVKLIRVNEGTPVISKDTYLLQAIKPKNLFYIANQIYESGMVQYCHPDFIIRLEMMSNPPTDPYYNQQYSFSNTGQYSGMVAGIDNRAESAWAITKGVGRTRVAVLDYGIESHADLVNTGSTSSDRVVDGYPWLRDANNNIIPGGGRPTFRNAHGQLSAGLIAATHDNGIGIAGMSPGTDIVPVNIYNPDGSYGVGSTFNAADTYVSASGLADKFNWAASSLSGFAGGRADIISCGFALANYGYAAPAGTGYAFALDVLDEAIANARTRGRNGKGCVVLFSAGNYPNPNSQGFPMPVRYPADLPGVITVGACSPVSNARSLYSATGPSLDIVAVSDELPTQLNNYPYEILPYPGVASLYFNNSFLQATTATGGSFGGTSAAVPQAAGVTALMLSVNPNLTELEVRTMLQSSATFMGAANGTGPGPATNAWNPNTGYGRLNAGAALRAALPVISGPTGITDKAASTYTVPQQAGTSVAWQITPALQLTNAQATGTSASFTAVPYPADHGQVCGTVTASITGPCGSVTISKDILIYPGATDFRGQVPPCGSDNASRAAYNISVYPNPVDNSLHLDLRPAAPVAHMPTEPAEYKITLYDSYGSIRRAATIQNSDYTLETNDLPDGIYFLRTTLKNSTSVKQIVVKH